MSVKQEDIELILDIVDAYASLDECYEEVFYALCDVFDVDPDDEEDNDYE